MELKRICPECGGTLELVEELNTVVCDNCEYREEEVM